MTAQAYAFNSAEFAFETFADEVVALNVTEGTYFAFGGAALEIWAALANRQPVNKIVDAIAIRHGTSVAAVAQEVNEFIEKLTAERVLVVAQPNDTSISLGEPAPKSGFRPITFEKHADMEDLLTLDPIHEVDPQRGWPNY